MVEGCLRILAHFDQATIWIAHITSPLVAMIVQRFGQKIPRPKRTDNCLRLIMKNVYQSDPCANVSNPQSLRERSRRSDRDAGHAHLGRTRSRQPGAELPIDQRLVFVTCELDHLSTARYHGPQ